MSGIESFASLSNLFHKRSDNSKNLFVPSNFMSYTMLLAEEEKLDKFQIDSRTIEKQTVVTNIQPTPLMFEKVLIGAVTRF